MTLFYIHIHKGSIEYRVVESIQTLDINQLIIPTFNLLNSSFTDNRTRVNGYLISEETLLHHGDRIELGVNHFFRLNCPRQEQSSLSPVQHITSLSDFKIAQEEVLLSKVVPDSNDPNKIYTNKTPQSSDSIDEDSVNLEYAVRKFEQNYSNSRGFMSTSSSSSSLGNLFIMN